MGNSIFTNILVTGGSGFVGRFLLESLLKDNSNKIIALYHNCSKSSLNSLSNERLDWKQIDLTNNLSIDELFEGIDVVYHLFGYSTNDTNKDKVNMLFDTNVNVTKKVLEASIRSGVKQFIYVSSIAACEGGNSKLINIAKKLFFLVC